MPVTERRISVKVLEVFPQVELLAHLRFSLVLLLDLVLQSADHLLQHQHLPACLLGRLFRLGELLLAFLQVFAGLREVEGDFYLVLMLFVEKSIMKSI